MKNRNVKWHKMSADAAIAQLHTNAACGLSRKAARSRYRKLGANTLFDGASVRKWIFWKSVLCDPAILFMLFSIVLAFLVGEISSVILAVFVLLGVIIVGFRLTGKLLRMHQTMASYRIPTVTVLREGRAYRVSARQLVVGDILLLQKGDIVGADCRVVSVEEVLSARLIYRNGEGKLVKSIQKKRADAVYPYESTVYAPNCENILYGKSEILSGSACAVVTEVGEYSYMGAMEINQAKKNELSYKIPSIAAIHPSFRAYSLLLFALLIPTAIIGFFVAPEGSSLLQTFLPLAVLCGVGACSLPEFYFQVILADGYRQCAERKKNKNASVLKSADSIDRLMGITDLFVVGPYATSDGTLHLHRAALGNGEVSLIGKQQPQLTAICEAYEILFLAQEIGEKTLVSCSSVLKDLSLRRELREICQYDAAALSVRLQSAKAHYTADGVLLNVAYQRSNVQYEMTDQRSILYACTAYEQNGKIHPLDGAQRDNLFRFLDASRQECGKSLIVMRRDGGRLILLGILSFREQVQPFLPSVLEELACSGVTVSFFLPNDTDDTLTYVACAKLPSEVCRVSMLSADDDLTKYYGKYRVFAGFSMEQIRSLFDFCKKNGRKIAVLGNDSEVLPLQSAASLRIACDALERDLKDHSAVSNYQDQQSVLAYAQMLIPRATQSGGGLASVLHALSTLRASRLRMNMMLRYLISSRLLHLVLIVLSVVSGIGLFNGAQLLWSGIVMDLVALVWILNTFIPQKRLRTSIPFEKKTVSQLWLEKRILFASISTAVILWGYAFLLSAFDVITTPEAVSYLFFSLLLTLAFLLYHCVYRGGAEIDWRYDFLPIAVAFLPVLILLAFSVLFPTLFSVSSLAWFGLVLLFSLPLAPLVFLLIYHLVPIIIKRRNS